MRNPILTPDGIDGTAFCHLCSLVPDLLWAMMAGGSGGYVIDGSAQFKADSGQYSTWTPAATTDVQRQTFTLDIWFQRTSIPASQMNIGSASPGGNDHTSLHFDSSHHLVLQHYVANVLQFRWTSDAVFRDVSAFGHLRLTFDSPQAVAADRLIVEWEGDALSGTFSGSIVQNSTTYFFAAVRHCIGAQYVDSPAAYFDGYLARFIGVAGGTLASTPTTETTSDGYFNPVKPSGVSYGTNGFWLEGSTFGTDVTSDYIPGATGTPIGDMTGDGGVAAVFDGNVAQLVASSATKYSTDTGYVGKMWLAAKTVTGYEAYSPTNDYGFQGSATGTTTLTLQGSNDTTNGLDGTWTDLQTDSFYDGYTLGSGHQSIKGYFGASVTQTTAYLAHRVKVQTDTATSAVFMGEVRFYEGVSKPKNNFTPVNSPAITNNSPTNDPANDVGLYGIINVLGNAYTGGLTISNAGTAFRSSGTAARTCRTTARIAPGEKKRFEYTPYAPTNTYDNYVGFCHAPDSLDLVQNAPRNDATCWSITPFEQDASNPWNSIRGVHLGTYGSALGTGGGNGVVVGVYFDNENGTIAINIAGGSLITAYTGLDTTKTWEVVVSVGDNAGGGSSVLNFGATDFAHASVDASYDEGFCTAFLDDDTLPDPVTGTFFGNTNVDGPVVWLGGPPDTTGSSTINGNAITWGTHAIPLATGFKVISSSSSYNAGGAGNTYSVATLGLYVKKGTAQARAA